MKIAVPLALTLALAGAAWAGTELLGLYGLFGIYVDHQPEIQFAFSSAHAFQQRQLQKTGEDKRNQGEENASEHHERPVKNLFDQLGVLHGEEKYRPDESRNKQHGADNVCPDRVRVYFQAEIGNFFILRRQLHRIRSRSRCLPAVLVP